MILPVKKVGNVREYLRFDGDKGTLYFEGDAQAYRGKGELEDIRANKDCVKKFAAKVTGAGVLTQAELASIDKEVLSLIERAVQEAKAASQPTAADLLTDVYVTY